MPTAIDNAVLRHLIHTGTWDEAWRAVILDQLADIALSLIDFNGPALPPQWDYLSTPTVFLGDGTQLVPLAVSRVMASSSAINERLLRQGMNSQSKASLERRIVPMVPILMARGHSVEALSDNPFPRLGKHVADKIAAHLHTQFKGRMSASPEWHTLNMLLVGSYLAASKIPDAKLIRSDLNGMCAKKHLPLRGSLVRLMEEVGANGCVDNRPAKGHRKGVVQLRYSVFGSTREIGAT